ncbi:MAG TPA: hypothetical protein VNU28_01145 [Solirubrobacteraceae bacterium]|nr:hypothetical protein [Solirubrobacteraceae bacterium]
MSSALVVALSAFGALTSTSAFAGFLLAEWLVNGVAVATELSIEWNGEMELEDTTSVMGRISVLCKGKLDGWVGPSSLDWISEVLTESGGDVAELVSAEALTCTNVTKCEEPLAWAVNLGWEGEVELLEQGSPVEVFFAVLTLPHPSGGNVGWEFECMKNIVTVADVCTAPESVFRLELDGTTLLGAFGDAFTLLAGLKLANCTQGMTAETGVVVGSGAITLTGGGTLAASSETSEA